MGLAALTFFFFGIMAALTKIMTETHSVIEIIFYRNAITVVPLAAFILWKNKDWFRIQKPGWLSLRCIGGVISMFVTFSALKFLPITDFTAILFLSTLLIPLGAHFLLKEKVGVNRMIAILIGLCGALIIIQPSGTVSVIGVTLGLLAALSHTAMYLVLRLLKTVNPVTITFYFILTCCLATALFMPWFARNISAMDLLFFAGIGVFGGLGQFTLTSANKYASPSLVAPFNYTGLIWATGFDILIWHHVPALHVYIGAGVIIAAKLYIIHRERLKKANG